MKYGGCRLGCSHGNHDEVRRMDMGVLGSLEPKEVFHYFEELCGIPHPSYKEKRISDYCVEFAKERGLEHYQDELGNVIIIKEATPGYEAVEPLILQGHLDMVCEKEPDCDINFDTDGLRLKIEGDFITAEGTTLGGDDGIAVAYVLAILDSDTLKHPRIEAVFTVSEEVGMEGAKYIDLSPLKGHRLLNIDSEEEGYLLTSCAGGCRAEVDLPVVTEEKTGTLYEVCVTGLLGGHSGSEIDKGRANSNLLFGRVLLALGEKADCSLAEAAGGQKDNAIPRETKCRVLVAKQDAETFEKLVESCSDEIAAEYAVTDPSIRITAVKLDEDQKVSVLAKESMEKVVLLLNAIPNGIQTMSADIPGLVETSLNLGVLELDGTALKLRYSVRSSKGTAKGFLVAKIRFMAQTVGAEFRTEGEYPAWEFKKNSALRETMMRVFREMYGKEPVIQAIHAGLECGLLSDKIPDLDAVSIGPDMAGVHTTGEKLSISSTQRVWDYLVELLWQ